MTAERNRSVLTHIQDAESWLSKARTNYLSNNRVRGELDLSLAQAETKHAWELSRGPSLPLPAVRDIRGATRLRQWWLPMAACLGLGLAAAAMLPVVQGLRRDGRDGMVKNQPEKPVSQGQRTLSADAGPGSETKRDEPSVRKPVETTARLPEQAVNTTAPDAPAPVVPSPAPADTAAAAPPAAVDPRPETDLKPANTGQGLGVDMGELERVAKESLTSK